MNSNKINLNELWSMQKAEQPSAEDLIIKMGAFKRSTRKKIIIKSFLLIATCVFIIFIWYNYQPQLLTTKIGITLTILAMAIFVFFSNKSLKTLKNTDQAASNQQYLKSLLALKEKNQFLQTAVLNLYFVLLSAGIALYMYEYTSRMTTFSAIVAYGIIAIWILFNWFYLRPKQIKKEQKNLNELIGKFEDIQTQLDQG